jgi:hypothetical protein
MNFISNIDSPQFGSTIPLCRLNLCSPKSNRFGCPSLKTSETFDVVRFPILLCVSPPSTHFASVLRSFASLKNKNNKKIGQQTSIRRELKVEFCKVNRSLFLFQIAKCHHTLHFNGKIFIGAIFC